jgi:hypothetical protein
MNLKKKIFTTWLGILKSLWRMAYFKGKEMERKK